MITKEKIDIFNKFSGDIDALSRVVKINEQILFEKNDDWSNLTNFSQDIELISKGLTSFQYRENALKQMKDKCDFDAFVFITRAITEYL